VILDYDLQFSDSQALTATAIGANVVDLGANPTTRDIGTGEEVYLVVQVDTELDSAGDAATLVITLESDSTADLATSATTHYSSGTIAEATCAAGAELVKVRLPAGAYERYLGIRYTVAVENFTSGAISAFLVKDVQADAILPDAL